MIEKIQVEVAGVAAMAFMFFVGWRLFIPAEVDGALVFLPTGSIGSLLTFAGIVWLLAAAMAVLTVSARAEGATLALLAGVTAAAMQTAPMRHLVNRFNDSVPTLMASLAGEIVCLALILLVATAVIGVVRQGLSYLLPNWMRPASMEVTGTKPAAPKSPKQQAEQATTAKASWAMLLITLVLGFGIIRTDPGAYGVRVRPITGRGGKQSPREWALSIVSSFGLTLLGGLLLMMVTFRATGSVERGQILFSLAISFFVAACVVSWFFPAGFSAPYWLAPLALAVVIYIRTCWVAPDPPHTWIQIGPLGNILPVDWLGAGCGGAVGGYWLSCRLHELKHFSDAEAEAE